MLLAKDIRDRERGGPDRHPAGGRRRRGWLPAGHGPDGQRPGEEDLRADGRSSRREGRPGAEVQAGPLQVSRQLAVHATGHTIRRFFGVGIYMFMVIAGFLMRVVA